MSRTTCLAGFSRSARTWISVGCASGPVTTLAARTPGIWRRASSSSGSRRSAVMRSPSGGAGQAGDEQPAACVLALIAVLPAAGSSGSSAGARPSSPRRRLTGVEDGPSGADEYGLGARGYIRRRDWSCSPDHTWSAELRRGHRVASRSAVGHGGKCGGQHGRQHGTDVVGHLVHRRALPVAQLAGQLGGQGARLDGGQRRPGRTRRRRAGSVPPAGRRAGGRATGPRKWSRDALSGWDDGEVDRRADSLGAAGSPLARPTPRPRAEPNG